MTNSSEIKWIKTSNGSEFTARINDVLCFIVKKSNLYVSSGRSSAGYSYSLSIPRRHFSTNSLTSLASAKSLAIAVALK